MNTIHLTKLDLNLLVVLEILLQERSVTRTAQRLGRTQSAVSHALARLRRQLDDPLLVRTRGEMVPSPWAKSIRPDLERLLGSLRRLLAKQGSEQHPRRVFSLCTPGFLSVSCTPLFRALSERLPDVSLDVQPPRRMMLQEVAAGDLDLVVAPEAQMEVDGLHSAPLDVMDWRVFARAGHPALDRWDADSWTTWPHLVVRTGADAWWSMHHVFEELDSLQRTHTVQVPGFVEAAMMVPQTDFLLIAPQGVMGASGPPPEVVSLSPPVELPPLSLNLYWGASLESTRSGAMFRDLALSTLSGHLSHATDGIE